MTLLCIEHPQSSAHKGNFLQGGKTPVNNINQQNANHRRNSCSPPLSKTNYNGQQNDMSPVIRSLSNQDARKLERSASEPRAAQSNTSRYKTELCRPYEENGTCKYGDKCQFAHGVKELRTMARHPKYKTELCRTFHSSGLCPYGPRCHFIHNSEQTKKTILTNLTGSGSPSPPMTRPKALTSLGSAGDVSPPSSHGGTPTVMKNFDDLFLNPISSGINDSFAVSPDFTNLMNTVNQRFLDYPVRDFNGDVYDAVNGFNNDGMMAMPDANVDNYNYQGSPVLDLFQTAPMTPTSPVDGNASFFRLPIFDLFHN